jgi:hypothetical protein
LILYDSCWSLAAVRGSPLSAYGYRHLAEVICLHTASWLAGIQDPPY